MGRATRLLNACKRQDVDATPVWLMRQAGRYMPAYRALRKRNSILELIKNPELAAEITLQPVHSFELDAAIIFSDILPPLEGMGLKIEFVEGDGPIIWNPVRTPADVDLLATPPSQEKLKFTLDAISMVRRELAGRVPLIGFAGAPFTLASYAVEGRSSRHFKVVKEFMYNQPESWKVLMGKLSRVIIDFLVAQVNAGAQVVQIFDSWAGALSPHDYRKNVLPHTRAVVQQVKDAATDIPLIYFGTGTAGILPLVNDIGADVIGVDWRLDILDAWSLVGDHAAVQGNLDPMVLCSSVTEIQSQTAHILDRVNKKNGHIFNLGHGVLKETPPDHVAALIDYVHEYSSRKA
jgi:uroporphyrinogen decarboxylase